MKYNLNVMKKAELIDVLKDDFGYSDSDLVGEDGKVFTNAELKTLIEKEVEYEKEYKIKDTIVTESRRAIGDNDLITVMNGLNGSLTHRSLSTGRVWKFLEFGQTDRIPYSEIISIRNSNPKVFRDGWLIVLNPQVQEELGVKGMYQNIITPDNFDDIISKSIEELNDIIDLLPEGMKETFFSKARELYQSGKIDSKKKIDFIENKFNTSFEDNAPLSDIV